MYYNLTKKLLLVLLSFTTVVSFAQMSVSGRVIDAKTSEPLIGATVLLEGNSNTGTITDFNGDYSISVPNGSASLKFSYAGYVAQSITVGSQKTINVSLASDVLLDEVVVVGYGSIKKKDATGAVVGVSEKDFNRGAILSPEQLIQGKAAGVQISSNSGEPGGGMNIRIRGTSSVRSGNNPLIVVDGVPLNGGDISSGGENAGFGSSTARNPLNLINPNDIATFDILKDASATAIYGSRGANGVILITTKKGKMGKPTLDYQFSVGVSTISKRFDLLNKSEFLGYFGANAKKYDLGGTTDWQDEIFRTANIQNHTINYGGGDENGDHRFSFSYNNQEGIIKNSGLERYSGSLNLNRYFLDKKLIIGTQLIVSSVKDNNVPITDDNGFEGDLIGAMLKSNPTMPVRDTAGNYFQRGNDEPNPAAMLALSKDYTNTLRALGNINATYKFTDALSIKTVIGFDQSLSSRRRAFSKDLKAAAKINGIGRLYTNDIKIFNKTWETYLNYDKSFGKHTLNAVLGYSYQNFDNASSSSETAKFETTDPSYMINNPSSGKLSVNNGSNTFDELQSMFGRVNFSIASKYLFTATLRADGSTKFGPDNKYAYFPSAAFKWRLIDEGFLPSVFSDAAVRVGYGITGNQEIPHNVYDARKRYGTRVINNDASGIDDPGFSSVSTRNSSLKWETTRQLNIGIDFGILKDRLTGSIDYYNKNTTDLLLRANYALPSPTPFAWTNLDATVVNTGVELALNLVAINNKSLRWDVAFNIAKNKNEVKDLTGIVETGRIHGQGLSGAFAQAIASGQPLYAYYLREFKEYDAEGVAIYSNGSRDQAQSFVDKSPLPTMNLGLNNTFTFGKFDFNFFFNGVFGHYIYSNTANAYFTKGALNNGRNVTRDVLTSKEGALNAPEVSTRFLEKGDFLRLQNATLGYNVGALGKYISNIRLYVTGQNLLTFTKYSGQDPEVTTNKAIEDIPSVGIDYTGFPRSRSFIFGVNVGF